MVGDEDDVIDLDALDVDIDDYGPPNAAYLACVGDHVESRVRSALLKSNCPVTGQPDWAEVRIDYRGPRIESEGLLRYLVSFRDHAEFHEQCVERIFTDLHRALPARAACRSKRSTRVAAAWTSIPGAARRACRRPRRCARCASEAVRSL